MIGGDVVNDVPPKDRDIAMVFQNYALYPHMTVAENMSFGLRLKRYPKAEIKSRIDEAARMLDIVELGRPQAEAIVRRPAPARRHGPRHRAQSEVFCSTNRCPTSTPSCACRCGSRSRRCIRRVRTTTVYVTHDQVEAMTLADAWW
jgi:multiple sugar transport system ATP-binding protein